MFAQRAPERRSPYPPWMQKVGNLVNQGVFPGMMGGGGQLALNQLLVVMDGIDNPPFMRRFLTTKINSFLDAIYIAPRRIKRANLRLPPPRPLGAQIYFIGATNVPMEVLDPALTRPGRMGRHVWFRTPTKDDRKDIFDLYLDRVAHDPELDSPVDQDARQLARPPPGVPEGGALQPVAERGDGRPRARPRRDGRGARLLRGDFERRRRRPPVCDRARRDDGGRGRHGPAAYQD